MKKFSFPGVLLGLFFAACCFTACQKEASNTGTSDASSQPADRTNGNAAVFSPNAHPHGKSYAEWSAVWWQEFMVFGCADNPFHNPDNILFYQAGPVYFMAGLSQTGGSVNVTVPHGKAILFPLFNYINDYPCPDANFQPEPGQTLEEFLTEGAIAALDGVTNLEVTVDGASVSGLENYLFVSELFYFTGSPDLAGCFDGCVTGTSQPAVSSGYFVMLKPLSKGVHTVHYHAEFPFFGAVQDGTFNITVE
jgi:hypothetical protein